MDIEKKDLKELKALKLKKHMSVKPYNEDEENELFGDGG